MVRFILILLLTGCVANIEPLQFDYSQNKVAWEAVKKKQALPTKNHEPSLEGLKIAYKDCVRPYALDKDVYNQLDYFAAPYEYYLKGNGDCEDFAICVFYKAKEMGLEAKLLIGSNGHPAITHVATQINFDNTAYIADNNIGYIVTGSDYFDKVMKVQQVLY